MSSSAGRGISSDWPGLFQSCMMTCLKDFLCSLELKSIETTITGIISVQLLDVVHKSQEDILESLMFPTSRSSAETSDADKSEILHLGENAKPLTKAE